MSHISNTQPLPPMRLWTKDLGVALVVLVALAAGWLLFARTTGQMRQFQPADSPFRIAYPATWIGAQSLQDALLKVEDPQAASIFKTSLTVETRDLDPQNPPTMQTLLDRRVAQRAQFTGYHFLSDDAALVDGVKAMQLQYAYVVQPIDTPRRAALPVVVRAREYIVVSKNQTYYITLAAPENEFAQASARFDRIMQMVKVQ